MSGKAIGKTLDIGYAGTVSRSQDCIISNRAVNKESNEIVFGQAVVLEGDNTVRKIKTGDTADKFFGIAIREVKQTTDYISSSGSYLPSSPCEILERGTVVVKCNNGTPKAGGKVYVRIDINESVQKGVVGEFEAVEDTDKTVELSNVVFTTGKVDTNGNVEITILTR